MIASLKEGVERGIMALLKRNSRSGFDCDEKALLGLLLAGETDFLTALRKHTERPCLVDVKRIVEPARLTYILVINGDLYETSCTAGRNISLSIDDLRVSDRRLGTEVEIVGHVHHGVLGPIVASTSEPVKWPRSLRVDDWWYVAPDGTRSKQRSSLEHLDIATQLESAPRGGTGPPPPWLGQLKRSSADGGAGLVPVPAADDKRIAEAEASLSVVFPTEFRELLKWSDGVEMWGCRVLGATECYLLDYQEEELGRQLVFALCDGDVAVFRLDDPACFVEVVDHETGRRQKVANSFLEWARTRAHVQ